MFDSAAHAQRRSLRADAIARREALDPARHQVLSVALLKHLAAGFGAPLAGLLTGFCWPYRNEFDVRGFVTGVLQQGGDVALCALAPGDAELTFRRWRPDMPLVEGAFRIPIPRDGESVVPDALLLPMNAFDQAGYRLGYGAGFFDRYLAAPDPPPLTIGLCFAMFGIDSMQPEAHDHRMDFIVTDAVIRRALPEETARLTPPQAALAVHEIAAARGFVASARAFSSPVCYAAEFPGYFGDAPDKH